MGKHRRGFFPAGEAVRVHFSGRRPASIPSRAGPQGEAGQGAAEGFKRSKQSWHGRADQRNYTQGNVDFVLDVTFQNVVSLVLLADPKDQALHAGSRELVPSCLSLCHKRP